jgi:alpha-1,3-glucosyltransferase
MAVTSNLPTAEWYYDVKLTQTTSEWTLDYPPFFAFFELLLSWIASWVAPSANVLSQTPVFSQNILYFQRASVVLSELVLLGAVYLYRHSRPSAALMLVFPGLVYVDRKD